MARVRAECAYTVIPRRLVKVANNWEINKRPRFVLVTDDYYHFNLLIPYG